MKRFLLLSLLCIVSYIVYPQGKGINVLSFKRDDTDLEALTKSVKDDNAQTCALLKIITTETGFVFEPDGNGFCKEIEYQTAEIRVWLPPGSRKITIKHQRFGQLRDYAYPVRIEAAKVYVMELQTIDNSSSPPNGDDVTSNYLAMTVTPSDAMVKIDGEIVAVSNGEFSKMYPIGKHKYEVYAEMYYPKEGIFDITANGTTELSIKLKPNFGYMEILSSPETGAQVYVNGKKVGVTPYKSDKMESGTYKVELIREMFKNTTQQVTVNDDKTTKVTIEMSPDFAEPVFVCLDEDAEIWVDGEKKGKKSWTGRLSAGPHRVEAKKTNHRTASKQITLATGNTETYTIPAPVPICGKLDVSSTPIGATIRLDGKEQGKTPMVIKKVLIGSHTLEIIKEKYAPLRKTVTIEEGKTLKINETLHLGPHLEVEGNLDTCTREVYYSASNMKFNITTDGKQIKLKDLPSWLVEQSVSKTSVEVRCLENKTLFPREGSFKIVADDLSEVVVVVKQKAAEPYLMIDNRSVDFSQDNVSESGFQKNYEVSTNFENVKVESNASWCNARYSDSQLHISIEKNPFTHKRSCVVSVKGSTPGFDVSKKCLITFSQKGKKPWLLRDEDDFASHFINFEGAYNVKNNEWMFGGNYGFALKHFGARVSFLYGLKNSWSASVAPVLRLTDDNIALDLQLYAGPAIFYSTREDNKGYKVLGDAGLRFGWSSDYDVSFWDFTLGCMFDGKEVIPNLSLGCGFAIFPRGFADGWFFEEQDFSHHFINPRVGYGIGNNDWLVGINYSWVPAHLGLNVSCMFGVTEGTYTATAGPVFRLTSDHNLLDLQLFGGVGIIGYNWNPKMKFGGEAGIRFAWDTGYDISPWDFTVGCFFAKDDIIPTLGVGAGIGPCAGFYGYDPWYLREEYDFACHFVDITCGYDVYSGDILVGADYTWLQTHLGVRGAFAIGVKDLSYTVFAGPAIRLTESLVDLQLYGGMGIFGYDGVQFGGDVGLKFGWNSNRDFSLWDFELGCAFSKGHIVPTIGVSSIVGGSLGLVLTLCLIPVML